MTGKRAYRGAVWFPGDRVTFGPLAGTAKPGTVERVPRGGATISVQLDNGLAITCHASMLRSLTA